MLTVCYAIQPLADNTMFLVLTAKPYWDANHFVDDGTGNNYDEIASAMQDIGIAEITESAYECDERTDIRYLANQLREYGIDLQFSQELANFISGKT